ncbi:hypothetical protein F5878DRAFT_557539 [Lentinula raphanica]|uniref:NUC153 domain-containing protein n=1 Tax=Lentinula raphanica TaxID=153919 RepID=A0AA38UH86_9AGAR|nr:hypothetical protein F5880DRAFT_1567656 [Lentinula raphanica]KAJ3841364.1 hypothetical protein F5878DRAFT_557539 [Lentinula raphanica]
MSDPRFARLKSDPRFRRPKKHQSKVVVDDRFKSVFAPPKSKKSKGKSGRVDKYGRPVKDDQDQENLKRFYRLENEEESAENQPTVLDYARGEVLLESSDEEEEHDDGDEGDNFVTVGQDPSRPISIRNDEPEIDLDENNFQDLDAQVDAYNASHPEPDAVPEATRTNRLAIVNLDWDHVRAIHLYKICSSLVSPTASAVSSSSKATSESDKRQRLLKKDATSVVRGRVLSVKIFMSQFGKERISREEKEGPPPEIFKRKQADDDEEVNERTIIQVGDENEFDQDALRKYQLERLRYYYAILECDTVDAASHIYDELEGTELERSANVFDMSFVPNDMTFEDEPRDEASEDEGATYKGVEFVTDALRHSKVKLTWDDDDPNRNQITRRKITRKEIEEADFKAYLASSSSESESDGGAKQKPASRDKLRSLLLGGGNELPEGWNNGEGDGDGDEGDVDMEVTFAPGLSTTKEDEDETTLEKYQRKMKEKRKKKKEQRPTRADEDEEEHVVEADDFFAAASEDEGTTEPSGKRKKKEQKNKEQEQRNKLKVKEVASENDLALLVGSSVTGPQHFNLKSVMKAEKLKGKKLKKRKQNKNDEAELQEDFAIDVHDDRFKAVHESHDFAIDPSNPHFKKTKAMKTLLDARSKTRDTRSQHQNSGDSLQSLVESVKRKSTSSGAPTIGKRRKL